MTQIDNAKMIDPKKYAVEYSTAEVKDQLNPARRCHLSFPVFISLASVKSRDEANWAGRETVFFSRKDHPWIGMCDS
jgi:hypothetical protein